MIYGSNLKKIRTRLGCSQVELAKKLKVNQVTVSSWETEVRHPSPRYVAKLISLAKAKGLEITYEDLRPE